jgi:branched-chain amino acid transport system permease protein
MAAFAISGFIAGLAGSMMALHNYSVVPEEFGFGMLVACLSFVILGGTQSLGGPVLGAFLLTLLPEVSRPLADNRMILYGALLMVVTIYLPHGIYSTAINAWRRRGSRQAARIEEAEHA